MNRTFHSITSEPAPEKPSRVRVSEILRGVLTKNPELKSFSVARILTSIGDEHVEASLVMFSVPAILPVPGARGIVAPASAVAFHVFSDEKQLRLPRFILRKQVSRRSLAVAIHALLPVLEAAERLARPRWRWVAHPLSRRLVGLLVFLLAVAIAYPLSGYSVLHALSIVAISLGMAEQDGLAVMLGIVAGIISLAILAGAGVTARDVRAKVMKALKKLARKLGINALTDFLNRLGYPMLAKLLTFQWTDLILWWDPEASEARRASEHVAEQPSLRTNALPVAANARMSAAEFNGASFASSARAGSSRARGDAQRVLQLAAAVPQRTFRPN